MRPQGQLTLALLKPTVTSSQAHIQESLTAIRQHGLEILRSSSVEFSPALAATFYSAHKGRFYYPRLVSHILSGRCVALVLYGPAAIPRWRELIGPARVYRAQWATDGQAGLRARYGLSDTRNGYHGSDSVEEAEREMKLIWPNYDLAWILRQKEAELDELDRVT